MPNIDQFESIFRSAEKEIYIHEPPEIKYVLIITDLDDPAPFSRAVRGFLKVLSGDVRWRDVPGSSFSTVKDLLDLVESEKPDLVVTYRNLHSTAWKWPHSLGAYLDVLTQATPPPVMVLPHPTPDRSHEHALRNTDSVMAITDHLTGDHHLVNIAIQFTQKNGTLFLTHVEDKAVLDRYIDIISKIPNIDTDSAREAISKKLLDEPNDYIHSCREVLENKGLSIKIEPIVRLGRHLKQYKRFILDHKVDLLVLNTRDEDQLAMHGLAYPLAVELREIPLLLL